MSQPNDMGDGGPAFPNTVRIDNEEFASLRGMSLRDYFAAKAMASYRIAQWQWYASVSKGGELADPDQLAKWAYADADALLRARTA